MEEVESLFEAVPLPYKYCRVPAPTEPDVVRKKKRRYFVNLVISQVTRTAFQHAGFCQTMRRKAWNASWGRQFDNDEFSLCKCWQKVNHYCGAWLIGRKDQLHKRLTEFRKRVGEFASFYPESYLMPSEREPLKRAWRKNKFWIVKPSANSNGRGIKIIASKDSQPPKKDGLIVQKYVMDPLLITGRKFDLRLYALVSSVAPFRIYMHESGLARFATHQYDTTKPVNDLKMHLTNFSVNKQDESFVHCDKDVECVENSKWSLRFLLEYFDGVGIDSKQVMNELERVTITTILSGMAEVRGFHNRYVLHRHTSYELYGIDVLLDSNLQPHVMEVNISPSLVAKDSQLDWDLKYPMVLDVLRMSRIIDCNAKRDDPCPGLALVDKKYRLSMGNRRKTQVETGEVNPWEEPVFADFVMIRDFMEERQRKGGFRRVYPKRKTMDNYRMCFDSLRYDDIVFGEWIAMSNEQRAAVIRNNIQPYKDIIEDIKKRLKTP